MQANDDVDSVVTRRLHQFRLQCGPTLEDVARDAQIDVSTLSRLESGKRRLALDHLPRLASVLSVSTDELLRAWPLPAGGLYGFKICDTPSSQAARRAACPRRPGLDLRAVRTVAAHPR
jgi:transcriptional regulator with XRE-family HTH domain